MHQLDLEVAVDDIATQLLKAGKTAEQVREILRFEADRVADEIVSGQWVELDQP